MKLQGVDTQLKKQLVKTICILKSNKNFNKNGIIKLCHFAPFLMPPDCPVCQQNQYSLNSFCRESLKEHFCQIILESDKWITEMEVFKVWVFFSISDAAATKVLHRM